MSAVSLSNRTLILETAAEHQCGKPERILDSMIERIAEDVLSFES